MTDPNTDGPYPADAGPENMGKPESVEYGYHSSSEGFYQQRWNEQNPKASSAQCAVCGATIPPTNDRCTDHQTSDARRHTTPPSEADSQSAGQPATAGEPEWSISRIGLAVVTASLKTAALASGAVALRRRGNTIQDDENYDLYSDFDDSYDTLSDEWDAAIPDAVKRNTSDGEALIEEALEKTAHEDSNVAYLFTEDGTPITDADELPASHSTDEESRRTQWVVPGVLYTPESTSPPRETRSCPKCGDHEHKLLSVSTGELTVEEMARVTWKCLGCGHTVTEVVPQELIPSEDETGSWPTAVGKSLERQAREEFQATMERLEANGELE